MAEQDFENLLKNINSINSQLNLTSKLLDDLGKKLQITGNTGLSRLIENMARDYQRLLTLKKETEAAALRTVSETRQGAGRGAPYGRVPGERDQLNQLRQAAERESARRGEELANAARLASERNLVRQTSDILRLGREVAQRTINEIQADLIRGAIEARQAGARPISAGLRTAADRLIYGGDFTNPQPAPPPRTRRYGEFGTDPFGAGGFGSDPYTISHPRREVGVNDAFLQRRAQEVARQVAATVLSAVEKEARKKGLVENLTASSSGGFGGFTGRVFEAQRWQAFQARRLPTFDANVQQSRFSIPGLSSATDRAKQAEEKLIQSLRARIASEEKYTHALEQARRLGFDIGNLRRVQSRGPAGVEQLQFERNEGGILRRFDTYVQPSGRATPGVSNQFRTFGQGVLRDIGELTKWSLALAAVYGPMRKVQELTQLMIENQTRLAEAVVSVSSGFVDQADIFRVAAESAEFAGESISGVIDAFTQAYRAAGGGGNEVERFATATQLLNDSLTLSKLSTLDQAAAIDTLSAALRQSGGDLSKGQELLDSWVRVTKVANIDLASLATGFAVLGDAAEAAGIGTNELNGVLAAIAETGVASGRELANTARALVAGFQSDQAREALENIGVAFEDTTGQARPFLEVMQELANLRQIGALDDTTFSRLTLALGGGTRRQAAFATFIENFERVGQVAEESSRASGDAQAALAKQLETVQTSLTRLGNAFQELAQTLGTKGGFLDIITGSVNALTDLVRVFDDLSGLLGKVTPALVAFTAASAVLRYRGVGGLQQFVGGIGAGLQRDPELLRLAQYSGGNLANVPALGRGRQFLQNNVLGTNAASGAVQGLLAAALPAILNFTNRDQDRFGGTKAAANIIGGVGGGVIGALVAGSPIIGAAIGAAISEAFVNATIARSTDIFAYAQGPQRGAATRGTSTEDLDEALRQAEIELYKSIGFGNEGLGRFLSTPTSDITVERLNEAIKQGNRELFEEILRRGERGLENFGVTPEYARQAFATGEEIQISRENQAYRMASEEARREYDRALAARTARGGTPLDQTTAFTRLVEQNQTALKDVVSTIKETTKGQLREQRVAGDVTGAEYARRTTAVTGLDVRALQYYTALGEQVDIITGGADDAAQAVEVLSNVIVRGGEDALSPLTSITGEIQTLINLLDDPVLNQEELIKLGGIEEARNKLEELQTTLANTIVDINKQALLQGLEIPEVQGDINKPLSQQEFGLVQQRARQLQDEFYQGFLQIPDDMYDALKGSFDEWAQIIENAGDVFYQRVTEIDPQFFQQAFQELLQQQKLKSQQESPFGIQQVDLPGSRAGELQGMINYFGRYLSQNFPQYEQKPEDIGVIFNDYVTSVLHGDNLAMKLALEKLVDINQKQLDGMYNIPEGATFWVPLTAAYYRPQNQAGGGGLPGLNDSSLTGNTNATDRNTQALTSLNSALQNEQRRMEIPQAARDRYNLALENERRRGITPEGTNLALANERRRQGLPYSATGTGETSILQQLQNWFRQLFSGIGQQFPYRQGPREGGFAGAGQSYRSLTTGATGAAPITPQLNARLDMRIDNQTQLIVDGRVLASVVSPYLSQELLRLEASQGTITKRYVI